MTTTYATFTCTCGHPPWAHGTTTYPVHQQPCNRCLNCGGKTSRRSCCLRPKKCPCLSYERAT